jgi:NAD(P)-dependent dehydrogenase (short-subunit alcohol dehydrogenase family)
MLLENKVAIVTGGGLNIGLAISRELAKAGARVVIADIAEQAAQDAARELRHTYGDQHGAYKTDMTNEASLAALVDFTLERYGRIDILVNNAAIAGPHSSVEDISLEEWRQSMAVNLDGVFLACKHVVPTMKQQKQGCIVNISSVSAKRPLPNRSPYCASKMGVIGLTRCLACELGPFGIRVNAVCPGAVDGPRQEMILRRAAEQAGISYEKAAEDKKAASPLHTFVPPTAVAEVVTFLCGSGSAMMTGQDINVSAGAVMY